MNRELRKLQRSFNAAMEEGDSELIQARGVEMLRAMSEQPRLSADAQRYREILIPMLAVVIGVNQHPEVLEGLPEDERMRVLIALGDEAMKMRKRDR